MSSLGFQDTSKARDELHETISLLAEKLDYPTRIDNAVSDYKDRILAQKDKNPTAFFAGVAGVAVVAGAIVVGTALLIANRFNK